MNSPCMCPAALACATRALVSGGAPIVLKCDHDANGNVLCRCCSVGICGAIRYVDEDGDLVYEHVSVPPRLRMLVCITPFGVQNVGMN